MARTLTLFPAPDEHGQRLAKRILRLGAEVGYQCRTEAEYSLRTGMRAQLCDDVAVYDLTTDGETIGAYRALSSFYVFLLAIPEAPRAAPAANVLRLTLTTSSWPPERAPPCASFRRPRFIPSMLSPCS